MNTTLLPDSKPARANSPGSKLGYPANPDEPKGPDLLEWLEDLWEGRYLVLGSLGLFLLLGGFYTWRTTPIYQADALLQIEGQKKNFGADATLGKMEGLFSDPSDTEAEMEILASNLVLGRVADALGLGIVAKPRLFPVVGERLMRGKPDAPRVDVESFEVPDTMRGKTFNLVALEGGAFRWDAPESGTLCTGKPGELLTGIYGGEKLQLQVKRMIAKPGQVFTLVRLPALAAIGGIRSNLDTREKGGSSNHPSNIIAISLKNPSPTTAVKILNEVMNQYIKEKMGQRSEEASRTLELMNQQLPEVHRKLEIAENNLNQFRIRSGSVDLTREADLFLQQSSSLAAQVSLLKQKKEELLRTYKENSDVVSTLNQQINKLQNEADQIGAKVRALPRTQQEVVRLSRDVQVNTELYTALLTNIQQLQVVRAGSAESARVLDPAIASVNPIRPKKGMLMAASLIIGLFVGTGLVFLRQVLRQGIKDHRLIESKLGMPVVVTIPHSKFQEEHAAAILKRVEGSHLLAALNPDDLATESLRSLRTLLHFSIKDAVNRVVMITGPSPSVGKSFVCANLSTVLAQAGARVLVVDADLRRGNLHHYFGMKNRLGGFSNVLSGETQWKDAVQATEIAGLDMMSTGLIPANPSELLLSDYFKTFVDESSESYDFVIIDAPPLLPVTDAAIIGSKAGTVFLVAKYGQHPLDELQVCQKRFESHGIPLAGCIFNNLMPTRRGYSYGEYRYAYHYNYR